MDKRPAGVTGLYNAEFMDHVQYPDYKYRMENATHTHEGVNPSCGDELTFYLRMADDGTIGETSYEGHGCAISQASADMMSDLMVGKTPSEAIGLCKLFGQMVRGEETKDDRLDVLEDAAMLKDISHMPARVKCAELAWRTLEEMLEAADPVTEGVSVRGAEPWAGCSLQRDAMPYASWETSRPMMDGCRSATSPSGRASRASTSTMLCPSCIVRGMSRAGVARAVDIASRESQKSIRWA